ncbi:DUF481 domain-containing protein [Maribacter sp.]|nr:DUF481 domain-containing protein [Maribacter sp.]
MKNVALKYIVIALLLSVQVQAYGQSKADTLSYDLSFDLSGSYISGLVNRTTVVLGSDATLRKKNWAVFNKLSYRFNITNGNKLENNWYDLASIVYYPKGRKSFYPIAFYHFESNLLYRVKRRHRFGVGAGSVIYDKNNIFLRAAAGILQESTIHNGSVFVNSSLLDAQRTNGFIAAQLNNNYSLFNDKVALNLEGWFLKSIEEGADYDIWFIGSLDFKLTKAFSFLVRYNYRFENVYLEGLTAKNDVLLFGAKFQI